MFWQAQNGKIFTKRLEINVVHHCNMSCRGCSHLSPMLPQSFISPDKLFGDLVILSRHCCPERVSLVGGEPLLHPDLLEIINAVRKSGITHRIRVVTNGLLLHRMPEQFWKNVDEVHLSLYPWHSVKIADLSVFKDYAKRHSATLALRYQDHFAEFFYKAGNKDDSLIRRIFLTCRYPRDEWCHTLEDGYYYKCPQAVFIPMAFKNRSDISGFEDGIDIRRYKNLAARLERYFKEEIPLAACRYCLGSAGKLFPSQNTAQPGFLQHTSLAKLIDWKQLNKLEKRRGLLLPGWFHSVYRKTNGLIAKLPAFVLLSSSMYKWNSYLNDFKRKYIR